MACLSIRTGTSAGTEYHLPANGETVIGRGGFCDLVLPHGTVSRHHARIISDHGQFFIEDLGSNNGTFVNGSPISGRTLLADGDRINLYDVSMRLRVDSANGMAAWTGGPHTEQAPAADPLSDPLIDTLESDSNNISVQQLRRRLRHIVDLQRRLGSTLIVEEILPRVLDILFEIFPQTINGQILLQDEQNRLIPVASKRGREDDSAVLTVLPSGSTLSERVVRTGEPALVRENEDADSVLDEPLCRMCAPMSEPPRAIVGVIELETDDAENPFVEEDLDLLASVGLIAGQALSYSRVHLRLLEADRRQRKLDMARAVQLRMLPRHRPFVPGYCFHDYYRPAEQVGGDYYGYSKLADGRIVISLADVCGKGFPAALTMGQLSTEVRHCLETCPTIKTVMHRLNRAICEWDEGMITFILCIVDPYRHRLTVANAGHPPPVRKRRGIARPLDLRRGGLPFGIDPDEEYHAENFPLDPLDLIALYTDGVSEAINSDHELYGIDRIAKALMAAPDDAEMAIATMIDDVSRFHSEVRQRDDICVVTFQRQLVSCP